MRGYPRPDAYSMLAAAPAARTAAHVPLTVVTRGDMVESLHAGSIAVVDRTGRVLYAAGDAALPTFTRSALKPLQALPFVAAGGVERFGFDGREVALLCASHSGEPRHVEAAAATQPQLDGFTAFPTTLFIGRDGRVRKVHAGFYGPATGAQHTALVQEFARTVDALLAEPAP